MTMAWRRRGTLLIVFAALPSCYSPRYDSGRFECGAGGACPSDYECGADHRCYPPGQAPDGPIVDAPLDGAAPSDASVDTAVLDATLVDARRPDARLIDAPTAIDAGQADAAGPPVYGGLVMIMDMSYTGYPEMGHGGQISVHFAATDPPTLASPQGDLGCNGWLYDDLSAGRPAPATDQGEIVISGTTALVPPCRFLSEIPNLPGNPVDPPQYACLGASGMGSGTIFVGGAVPAGHAALEIPTAGFSAADVGRYLTAVTSEDPSSKGPLPIVSFLDTNANGVVELVVPQANFTAGTFTQGAYVVVAGFGPVPGSPPPEFLADTDTVKVALTAGGEKRFESFSVDTKAGGAFTLTPASETILTNLPYQSGEDVSLSCSSCGTANASVVTIETTDGSVAGFSGIVLPRATRKLAKVTCVTFGQGGVTVPANVLSLVASANPTRVQTTFLRANIAISQVINSKNRTITAVGHAVTGFTTPATP